jgi:hypothetical protein
MLFGSAVHAALAVHYIGGDGDRTFKAEWFNAPVAHAERWAQLGGVGLHLLEGVYALELAGQPEYEFSLSTEADWLKPTVGFIDLVDWEGGMLYDFKTTIGDWGNGRANQDPWQPTLYRMAAADRTGIGRGLIDFDFAYVTLNKRTLEVGVIQPTVPFEQRLAECLAAGSMIAAMDAAGSYPCRGGHGTCPECAGSWAHGHVCDWSLKPPRIHIAPKETA